MRSASRAWWNRFRRLGEMSPLQLLVAWAAIVGAVLPLLVVIALLDLRENAGLSIGTALATLLLLSGFGVARELLGAVAALLRPQRNF